jgi:hypothetical protein
LRKGPNCNYKKLNMDLNVKLQGLKYNYEKVQWCFCQILSIQRFSRFMELFSLRKICRICPWHRGQGPPAPAHGSMNFIKCRLLATGSTAQIDPSESVSRLLISAVHHRSDGRGGWLWWLVFDEVCSYWITGMRGMCLC